MKKQRFARLAVVLLAATFSPVAAEAQATPETSYYWVTPVPGNQLGIREESFVIAVDAVKAGQIEVIRGQGHLPGFSGQVAAGSVSYNRDYFAPHRPLWNWHIASVDEIFDFSSSVFSACECANLVSRPADIAQDPARWIQVNGAGYTPVRYRIQNKIEPSSRDAMANVSNRGLAGAGEKTLIAGFIVTGGEPRNIVVRALGPSLRDHGLQQAADNPKLTVFAQGAVVAENSDWKTDARASLLETAYQSLRPERESEAALFLTLLPGAYTLHGSNEDGREGVILLEVYDVDAGIARRFKDAL